MWPGLYKKPRTVLPYIFLLQRSQCQNHRRVYRVLSPAYWWLLCCSCCSLCFSNTSSDLGNFLGSRVKQRLGRPIKIKLRRRHFVREDDLPETVGGVAAELPALDLAVHSFRADEAAVDAHAVGAAEQTEVY